jgi:GNAT superfamily N-acetyltransferase
MRFFSGAANLEHAARWAASVDGDHFGLVASAGGEIVGHSSYQRTGAGRAEVALEVADRYQGRGLGTILLGQLAQRAEAEGIGAFEAEIMADNRRMIEVFRDSGFPLTMRARPGTITVEFPTSLSAAGFARFEAREQVAAASAVGSFLKPRSVAVIGAGGRRRSRGPPSARWCHGGGARGDSRDGLQPGQGDAGRRRHGRRARARRDDRASLPVAARRRA